MEFPKQFRVCKGFYGQSEHTSFSEGDHLIALSSKQTKVITVELRNGSRINIPVNSAKKFGILYNPDNDLSSAKKGYRFETVSELLHISPLPVVIFARKAFQGSSAESSISENEILLIKKVTKKFGTKHQLKVFSLNDKREKFLNPNCAGSFSTRPKDVCLFLPEILNYLPDIFPCEAILLNVNSLAAEKPQLINSCLLNRSGSMMTDLVVTMTHSSIETTIIATSVLEQNMTMVNAHLLNIPIDLDILVCVEHTADEEKQHIYEDTPLQNLNEPSDPSTLNDLKSNLTDSPDMQSHLYTKVHYGHIRDGVNFDAPQVLSLTPRKSNVRSNTFPSLSEGDSQIPRKLSDPNPRKSPSQLKLAPSSCGIIAWRPPLPPPRVTKDDVRSG